MKERRRDLTASAVGETFHPMPTVHLRRGAAHDLDGVTHVFIEARTRCLPFLGVTYDFGEVRDHLRAWFARAEAWCAEAQGSIVGFVVFTADEVEHLYVLPEWHGRGIGSALLEKALEGASEMRLWVFQENRLARAFYEQRGFRVELETDGRDNMEKTPDARYVWRRHSTR
jgi:ribosomal protein S18 acetylase RimI-like enzyme